MRAVCGVGNIGVRGAGKCRNGLASNVSKLWAVSPWSPLPCWPPQSKEHALSRKPDVSGCANMKSRRSLADLKLQRDMAGGNLLSFEEFLFAERNSVPLKNPSFGRKASDVSPGRLVAGVMYSAAGAEQDHNNRVSAVESDENFPGKVAH